jgi:hypothetical protein
MIVSVGGLFLFKWAGDRGCRACSPNRPSAFIDPDDAPVTYTVEISKSADFNTIEYRVEGLRENHYFVGKEAELDDLTRYYWRVIAVDQYGSKSIENTVWYFDTDNTNGIPGFITCDLFYVRFFGVAPLYLVNTLSKGRHYENHI